MYSSLLRLLSGCFSCCLAGGCAGYNPNNVAALGAPSGVAKTAGFANNPYQGLNYLYPCFIFAASLSNNPK
jgi:hypothetical protein